MTGCCVFEISAACFLKRKSIYGENSLHCVINQVSEARTVTIQFGSNAICVSMSVWVCFSVLVGDQMSPQTWE